jgi:hypothetical protein
VYAPGENSPRGNISLGDEIPPAMRVDCRIGEMCRAQKERRECGE